VARKGTSRSATWEPIHRPDIARLHASGEELEIALKAAEQLLAQGEEARRHAQNVRLAAVSLFLLTIASVAGIVIAIVESARTGGIIGLGFLLCAATPVLAYLLRLMNDVDSSAAALHRDAATDIAGMVREVFLDVAERERWSRVRLESTRIRLAAFPLRERITTTRPRLTPLAERRDG